MIENFSNIGDNLHLPHGLNIIINPEAIIGDNVTIYQGVTIGVIHQGPKKGAPTLQDNVQIGPNAVVVGKVTPPYATVIGNPAQIHLKK